MLRILNNNEKTTITKAQGSKTLKKQKTSNEKDELNDKAIAESNRSVSKLMNDIQFDILLEIFSLLEPNDLLHFSRVSKGLHDLLTSNDLLFLWKLIRMLGLLSLRQLP